MRSRNVRSWLAAKPPFIRLSGPGAHLLNSCMIMTNDPTGDPQFHLFNSELSATEEEPNELRKFKEEAEKQAMEGRVGGHSGDVSGSSWLYHQGGSHIQSGQ